MTAFLLVDLFRFYLSKMSMCSVSSVLEHWPRHCFRVHIMSGFPGVGGFGLIGRRRPPAEGRKTVGGSCPKKPMRLVSIDQFSRRLKRRQSVGSIIGDGVFLLSAVITGWLNSSSIVLIPDDLRPAFSVALGLKDGTAEEWKDFSGMFARSARHIQFSAVKGYDGK